MSNPQAGVDPKLCPLCGQANRCAMEIEKETGAAQPPCWCSTMRFDAQLLDPIPTASRNLACICATCASNLEHQNAIK